MTITAGCKLPEEVRWCHPTLNVADNRLQASNPKTFLETTILESLSIGKLKSGCLQKISTLGEAVRALFFFQNGLQNTIYCLITIQIIRFLFSKFVWYMIIHLCWCYLQISWMVDKPVQYVARGRFFQNGRQILQNVLMPYPISFSK